jgi:hypothetical protein
MTNEFKTPWRVVPRDYKDGFHIEDAEGNEVADDGSAWDEYRESMTIESARRIIACVNACAGIDTEKLEKMPRPFGDLLSKPFKQTAIRGHYEIDEYAEAKAQRNELMALALMAQEFCRQRGGSWAEFQGAVEAAVAKAKGGAA